MIEAQKLWSSSPVTCKWTAVLSLKSTKPVIRSTPWPFIPRERLVNKLAAKVDEPMMTEGKVPKHSIVNFTTIVTGSRAWVRKVHSG